MAMPYETNESLDKRMAERRDKIKAERWEVAKDKRFRLIRQCSCVSDGWGCCCAQPIHAVIDDGGDYKLVRVCKASIEKQVDGKWVTFLCQLEVDHAEDMHMTVDNDNYKVHWGKGN